MRRRLLPWLVPCLMAFTPGTSPTRQPTTSLTTNGDYIYVHDANVGGASTGVPNATPKLVTCTNTQALGYDTATKAFVCLSTGSSNSHRITYSSVFMTGAALVASTTVGGGEMLSDGLINSIVFEQIRFNISNSGAGGSTDIVIRAASTSPSVVTCDFSVPCNQATGPTVAGGIGSPAACTFPTGSLIVYTVNSIGDCATGPTIFGNLDIDGYYN